MMARHHGVEFLTPSVITVQRHLRGSYQLVGNAAKCAYYHYDRLRPSLCLHDFLQAKNAFHGTYGRSAKFEYFHIAMRFILPDGTPERAGLLSIGATKLVQKGEKHKRKRDFFHHVVKKH
jgi:hypothetical protein